jgi:hypothetical protein
MDYRRIIFSREPEYHIEALREEDMKKLLEYLRNDTSKNEIVRMRDYAIGLVLTYA